MKRETVTLTIQRPRTRAHRVLFQADLPFSPKVERNRKQYQRQAKHQGRAFQDQ